MEKSNILPKFIPELDGLRAFAVIGVIFYHFVPGFGLGWTGVYLFFVISGFLITGILLDSKENPHYFRNFYIRRVLRIFPIYYLSLLAVSLAGLYIGSNLSDFPFYLFYLQNYTLAVNSWHANFINWFDHTWSLAVEEQFYFIWPFLVYKLKREQLPYLLIVFIVFSYGCRLVLFFATEAYSAWIWASLPTVLDSLSIGALLALASRSKNASAEKLARNGFILMAASGTILFFLGLFRAKLPAEWGLDIWNAGHTNLTLLGLFFGGLIAFVIFRNSWLSRVLRFSWLRKIGKISYGLYLYHYPIYHATDLLLARFFPDPAFQPSDFLIISSKFVFTFLAAVISWNLIEAPLNAQKDRFTLGNQAQSTIVEKV